MRARSGFVSALFGLTTGVHNQSKLWISFLCGLVCLFVVRDFFSLWVVFVCLFGAVVRDLLSL